MSQGLFIVFEGIDGSGTSTQSVLLRDGLLVRQLPAVLTCEPSEGPIGNLIRQAMKGRVKFCADPAAFDRQMAHLFAADRHDHLYNETDGVLKLLRQGTHVVCTRYVFSSYAYHCHDEESLAFVQKLNEDFPRPDLLIYLDNAVACSLQRMANRSHREVYENERKLTLVAQNYQRILADYPGRVLRLNAAETPDALHQAIMEAVMRLRGPD